MPSLRLNPCYEHYAFLCHHLSKECSTFSEIRLCVEFFQKLMLGDRESKRLLICISIDLKREAFGKGDASGKKLKNLITKCYKSHMNCDDIVDAFSAELANQTPSERSQSKPLEKLDREEYFTVMTMQSYIDHYFGLAKYDPKKKMDYWQNFDNYINPAPRGTIGLISPNLRVSEVFVSENEFWKNLKSTIDEQEAINELIYRLGFNVDRLSKSEYFVRHYYPTDFAENCFQPTAWNARWGYPRRPGNPFFLSFGNKDDWGRTFSSCGRFSEGVKERIFFAFNNYEGKTPKYSGFTPEKMLFTSGTSTDPNSDNILFEGNIRFNAL